jgi:hypothetical protein
MQSLKVRGACGSFAKTTTPIYISLLLIKHELKLPSEVRPGLLFIQIQFQAVWFQYSFEKLNNGAQFLSVKLKKKPQVSHYALSVLEYLCEKSNNLGL